MTSKFFAPKGIWFAGFVMLALLSLTGPGRAQNGAGALSVSGNTLLRDGQPFFVKGVQVTGFVASQSVLRSKPWYLGAYKSFGRTELETAASVWHANTILFKLGQPELDPQDRLYSQGYIHEMTAGVGLARSLGFSVIVSVDELPPSGTPSQSPLPTRSTQHAVQTLAKLFGSDPGIMIELYNEPFSPSCAAAILSTACSGVTPDAWALWRDGDGQGSFVGINALIETARSAGARNVLLVQPLGHGGNFEGFPEGVSDPMGQILYAVHPYFLFSGMSAQSWDSHFGAFAANHPLIADEWEANSKAKMCTDPPGAASSEFLQYLGQRNIGLVVWSIDLPGTMVKDRRGTPNDFGNYRCGQAGGGAGSLVVDYFARS